MLLAFMVLVPCLVWLAYDYQQHQLPGACGTKSVTEAYDFSNSDPEGKNLFMTNCAACHNMIKDATGPALMGILNGRDSSFLNSFLRKRRRLKKDEVMLEHEKMFAPTQCMEFPMLTREQVRKLERYIRDYQIPAVSRR